MAIEEANKRNLVQTYPSQWMAFSDDFEREIRNLCFADQHLADHAIVTVFPEGLTYKCETRGKVGPLVKVHERLLVAFLPRLTSDGKPYAYTVKSDTLNTGDSLIYFATDDRISKENLRTNIVIAIDNANMAIEGLGCPPDMKIRQLDKK